MGGEDVERRRRSAAAVQASLAAREAELMTGAGDAGVPQQPSALPIMRIEPEPVDTAHPDHGTLRIAVAAGA